MKEEKIELKKLTTIKDFKELLVLSELNTQMEVLGFLQENLFEYQMNYLKSQLMLWDEILEYIPDNEKHLYFKERKYNTGDYDRELQKFTKESWYSEYNFEYAIKEYTETSYFNKISKAKKSYFVLDTINKIIYYFPKCFLEYFKFFYKKDELICKYFDSRQYISFDSFTECHNHDNEHTIEIIFNLNKNLFKSFKEQDILKNKKRCGSWGDYGYYSKDNSKKYKFISDEEEYTKKMNKI